MKVGYDAIKAGTFESESEARIQKAKFDALGFETKITRSVCNNGTVTRWNLYRNRKEYRTDPIGLCKCREEGCGHVTRDLDEQERCAEKATVAMFTSNALCGKCAKYADDLRRAAGGTK